MKYIINLKNAKSKKYPSNTSIGTIEREMQKNGIKRFNIFMGKNEIICYYQTSSTESSEIEIFKPIYAFKEKANDMVDYVSELLRIGEENKYLKKILDIKNLENGKLPENMRIIETKEGKSFLVMISNMENSNEDKNYTQKEKENFLLNLKKLLIIVFKSIITELLQLNEKIYQEKSEEFYNELKEKEEKTLVKFKKEIKENVKEVITNIINEEKFLDKIVSAIREKVIELILPSIKSVIQQEVEKETYEKKQKLCDEKEVINIMLNQSLQISRKRKKKIINFEKTKKQTYLEDFKICDYMVSREFAVQGQEKLYLYIVAKLMIMAKNEELTWKFPKEYANLLIKEELPENIYFSYDLKTSIVSVYQKLEQSSNTFLQVMIKAFDISNLNSEESLAYAILSRSKENLNEFNRNDLQLLKRGIVPKNYKLIKENTNGVVTLCREIVSNNCYFEDEFPLFNSKIDIYLTEEEATLSREEQKNICNDKLVELLKDRKTPSAFTENQKEKIIRERTLPVEFAWHHHQEIGRMQVVLREEHKKLHLGGYGLYSLS